ncbi:hypothetical protein ACU635_15685 [[Actinomadura] parvosata]|uniref:hypothetical protein n=1 Tax=[Actinomadura] parvosata TaxID=1955412 RepID=UPI00406C7929
MTRGILGPIGGGAAVTALLVSGVLPVALLIIAMTLLTVLGIVAFALLGRGDERTPFERLMFLLCLIIGDRSGLLPHLHSTGSERQREALEEPVQADPHDGHR